MTELYKINDPKSCLKVKKPPHGNNKSNCFVRQDTKWSSVLLTKSPENLCALCIILTKSLEKIA